MNKHLKNYHPAHYACKYGLQPADGVKEPIFQTGISKHYAIYLGMDENGIEWISENHKFAGVRLVEAGKYFKDNKIYSVVSFKGDYNQRKYAVQRALQVLGKPYDLILYNCEHYSSFVQTGIPKSNQVEIGVLAVIGILFYAFAVSHE